MKIFACFLLSTIFVVAAFAQNIAIGYPPNNAIICAGSRLTIEVKRPDSLTGSRNVAIVIGIETCPCMPPADGLGHILFAGLYNPQHEVPGALYQNYTVTIPTGLEGEAKLGFAHFTLIGDALFPALDLTSLNVTIKDCHSHSLNGLPCICDGDPKSIPFCTIT